MTYQKKGDGSKLALGPVPLGGLKKHNVSLQTFLTRLFAPAIVKVQQKAPQAGAGPIHRRSDTEPECSAAMQYIRFLSRMAAFLASQRRSDETPPAHASTHRRHQP